MINVMDSPLVSTFVWWPDCKYTTYIHRSQNRVNEAKPESLWCSYSGENHKVIINYVYN